jgi:hypothetical protein
MNFNRTVDRNEPRQGSGARRAQREPRPQEEEELETGEPIEDEGEPMPAPKKIPGKRGKFDEPTSRSQQPEPDSSAPGGRMVLATAKYLKMNQEQSGGRKGRRNDTGQPPAQNSGASFESRVLNGGVAGGMLAMAGAVVWFVLGLMADRIFIYPPILFVLGLVAVFRGLARGE